MKEFAGWRLQWIPRLASFRSLDALRVKIDQIAQKQEEEGNPAYKVFQHEGIDLTKPAAIHLTALPFGAASGQFGHDNDPHHRGIGYGVVTTIAPPPVKGMSAALDMTPVSFSLSSYANFPGNSTVPRVNLSANLPQISFPEFDGRSPKLWKKKCETYFDIYDVPSEFQVKLATMYFVGPAVFWLQSLEHSVSASSWKLCLLVCKRFDRD